MIHTQLYNNVKLISFKVGEVTLNTNSRKDPHFNRTVAKTNFKNGQVEFGKFIHQQAMLVNLYSKKI